MKVIIYTSIIFTIIAISCDNSSQKDTVALSTQTTNSIKDEKAVAINDSILIEITPADIDSSSILHLFQNYISNNEIIMHDRRNLGPVYFDINSLWKSYSINDSVKIISTIHNGEICEYFIVFKNDEPYALLRSFISDSTKIYSSTFGLILIKQFDNNAIDFGKNPNMTGLIKSEKRHIFINRSIEYIFDEIYNMHLPGDSILYSSDSELILQNNLLMFRIINNQQNIYNKAESIDTLYFSIPPKMLRNDSLPPNIFIQKNEISRII